MITKISTHQQHNRISKPCCQLWGNKSAIASNGMKCYMCKITFFAPVKTRKKSFSFSHRVCWPRSTDCVIHKINTNWSTIQVPLLLLLWSIWEMLITVKVYGDYHGETHDETVSNKFETLSALKSVTHNYRLLSKLVWLISNADIPIVNY